MASLSEWKEQMMRRKEGSGEKEFRRATTVIWLRMASSEEGWKRMRSWSSVIRRVLEGGVGCDSGGMLERSMESDGREDDREEERLSVEVGSEPSCGTD
jgi:hypothetical protein